MKLFTRIKWLALGLIAGTILVLLANTAEVDAQSSGPTRLTVLQSDANRIVLELQSPGFESRDVRISGETLALYSIGDLGHTTEPGKPQLPVQGTMVAIPPGAQAAIKILDDQSQASAAPRLPAPAVTPIKDIDPRHTLPAAPTASYPRDAATYAGTFPASPARLGSTGDWRSQHYVTVQFYPLQYSGANRQLILHRRVRIEITLSYPRGQSPAALGGAVNEGAFESAFASAFVNYSSAKNWRARANGLAARAPQAPRASSICPNGTGPCYKLGVDTDGMYKVACNQLPGAAAANVVSSTLQMFKNGVELAIRVQGGWGTSCSSNDYVEFFGKGIGTTDPNYKYTNTNIYWLTYGINPGLRMAKRDGTDPGGTTAAVTFTNTVRIEENIFYRPGVPMEEADHWFWTLLYVPYPPFDSVDNADYPFSIDTLASGDNTATLQVVMVGVTSAHETQISLNGTLINDTSWSGAGEHTTTIPVTQSLLTTSNTIHLYQPTADSGAISFLNYFTLTYASTFSATNNVLRFQQPITGSWLYTVTNFVTNTIDAFDISNPFSVTQIVVGPGSGPGPYALQFADNNPGPRDLIALSASGIKSPSSITKDTPNNLLNTANSADYVIIAASSLTSSVQSLQTLRSGQFPRPAKLVDIQDVYDEFNDGVVNPKAIRDFLQYAYTSWVTPSVSYVLLVGAGNFDPKGYCTLGCLSASASNAISTPVGSNLLTPYLKMVDPNNFNGEVPTDNCLVSFDADCSLSSHTLPYMHIGRLPADSPADVTALVNKIIAYEHPPAGAWRSTSSFVTANAFEASGASDPGGNFWFYSDEIIGDSYYFPNTQTGERIYFNPCLACVQPYPTYQYCNIFDVNGCAGTPNVLSTTMAAINAGRLFVNYVGHGARFEWASRQGESLLQASDLSSLTNGSKTPIMLELTCNTGYYIYPLPTNPTAKSLAKTIVNLAGKGAVASWAATGQGVVTGHDLMEKGFFEAVMRLNERRLGPATMAGKVKLNGVGDNLDLLDTIILFGDPATSVAVAFPSQFYLPLVIR